MPSEIERKFLLSTPPASLAERPGTPLEQGYLAISERAEVRLRRAGEERTLTVKLGHGESREEVEVPLPREQFERLWPLTEGARVAKTRRLVSLPDGLRAEVDVYNGACRACGWSRSSSTPPRRAPASSRRPGSARS